MSTAYCIKPANGKIRTAVRIASSLGIKVKIVPRDLIRGCSGETRVVYGEARIIDRDPCILVADDLCVEEQRLTITHELAHIFLGHLLSSKDSCFEVPGEQMEFEAETLGFILYNFLYGIDGGRKPI